MLHWVSYLALAVMVAAIAVGWSRRFLAVGALALGNVFVYVLTVFGPQLRFAAGGRVFEVPVLHWELSLHAQNLYDAQPFALVQLFSSMFVHADLMHLVGNMFILLAFALVFEELIGPRKFIVIYLISGVIGALAQVGYGWGDPLRLLGASGAVFGIIGAFAGSYPNMVMRLPIPVFIIMFVRMRVITAAVVFGLLQVAFQFFSTAGANLGAVAFIAHIGGLAGGFVLGSVMLKRHGEDAKTKPVRIDFGALQQFATDAPTQRALDEMQANADEPDVFKAWFQRFWEGARDPDTEQRVRPGPGGKVVREDGKEFDIRMAE